MIAYSVPDEIERRLVLWLEDGLARLPLQLKRSMGRRRTAK